MKMNYEKEMASVLKQAMAESRRRGRTEEKLEVAMKMMETGFCFDEIYIYTGMKKEEIMFELDGLISTVKQTPQHEHQPAQQHEPAEPDTRMDGTDDPWADENQWTKDDPWGDGDPWAKEDPRDWVPERVNAPWRMEKTVPNLWAQEKPGNRNEETVVVNEELKETLTAWRREQSRTEEIRAYRIIPQRTLMEIATKIPKTRDELMAINGFGNARWEKYGETILQITSEF